jgi:hypothetical protein
VSLARGVYVISRIEKFRHQSKFWEVISIELELELETQMDLGTCLSWKNRRVLLLGKAAVVGEGQIVHVAVGASLFGGDDDIDLVIRLINGLVTSVKASDQGRTWKFGDASDRPAA